MEQLLIRKNKLVYNGETFEINDLFTNELYQYSNDTVQDYISDICIDNEIFLNRIQPALALILFIKEKKIEIIKIEEPDELLYPIIVDIVKTHNLEVTGVRSFIKYKKIVMGHLYTIISALYLLWRMILIPHSDRLKTANRRFSIIRTPAAQKKLAFLSDIDIQYEDVNSKETVYKYFSRRKRALWVFKSWLRAYSELECYSETMREKIGDESAADVFYYYSKRVVHTLLYSFMIDCYFSINKGNTFYTGNNLDRFAILEEKIANKYNINTVCIPHGLEYGFKLPHCFTGNTFYTTSKQAAEHLNVLYSTEKFKYNEEIAQQMFATPQKLKQSKNRRLVFFTEPREVYVNIQIIDDLLPLVNKEKMQLNIKLHPKDSKVNYKKYGEKVKFLDDFNDSIIGNICFSRKSTTLLEAVYNDSIAGAILVNEKDRAVFNTFPSLQDKKIKVFYNTSGLFEWIKKECG